MDKNGSWSNGLLLLLFQNTAVTLIGDAAGLQPAGAVGNLYISLHNADPGTAGNQTTNETAYGGYARVPVPRSNAGWTVTANNAVNANVVVFPLCTGGADTITYFGIGTDLAGAGKLLYSFPLVTTWYGSVMEASTGEIHAQGSTFNPNDPIVLSPIPGGAVPAAVTIGTVYYVKTVHGGIPDTFTISATPGGGAISPATDGAFAVGKMVSLAVAINIGPAFAAGAISVTEI